MLKNHTPKKIIKQSTVSPNKKNKPLHRKTISLVEKRQEQSEKQWNNFIELYHNLKQIHLINCSFNTVNSHFQQKTDLLSIRDVPFIKSEQVMDSCDQEQSSFYSSANDKIQQNSIDTYSQQKQQTLLHKFLKIKKKQGEFEENIITKNQMINNFVLDDIDDDAWNSRKSPTFDRQSSQGSQNFTQEDQQERNSKQQEINTNIYSKKSISTNKNSQGQSHMLSNQQQNIQREAQKLRRTAHFSYGKPENQQNVNTQNKVSNSKLLILKKIQQEKNRNSTERHKNIVQDKQFLGKLIWK